MVATSIGGIKGETNLARFLRSSVASTQRTKVLLHVAMTIQTSSRISFASLTTLLAATLMKILLMKYWKNSSRKSMQALTLCDLFLSPKSEYPTTNQSLRQEINANNIGTNAIRRIAAEKRR
ncbi:hypothetical protein U1Q18_020717 [Sarracenia purpurea var. burkii]